MTMWQIKTLFFVLFYSEDSDLIESYKDLPLYNLCARWDANVSLYKPDMGFYLCRIPLSEPHTITDDFILQCP